jgi:hypothetical protein
MGAWEHGSMGAWEHGSMGAWGHGSMGAWEHGSMAECMCIDNRELPVPVVKHVIVVTSLVLMSVPRTISYHPATTVNS